MRVTMIDPEQFNGNTPATPCVLALGFFDGVHRGHQQVIAAARAEAQERQLPLAVMTFDRHVSQVFPMPTSESFRYLTTVQQKADLMADLGVEQLYVVRFTKTFAGLEPQAFVDQYLIGLGAQCVVAGFDYTFGRGGKATAADLPHYGHGRLAVRQVGKLTGGGRKISSTRIRALVAAGDVAGAGVLLGHPYQVMVDLVNTPAGLVVRPQSNRQQLPTAGDYTVALPSIRQTRSAVLHVDADGVMTLDYRGPLGGITRDDQLPLTFIKAVVAPSVQPAIYAYS